MKKFLKNIFIIFFIASNIFLIQPKNTNAQAEFISSIITNGVMAAKGSPTASKLLDLPGFLSSQTMYFLVFKPANWILVASGGILDWVLKYTLIGSTSENNNQWISSNIENGASGIIAVWNMIRNLINLSFIFLLLYEGFKSIFGLGGNVTETIGHIILTALSVNFSLFITKVAIDISNIFTVFLYNAITNNGTQSISNMFASLLNLKTIIASVEDSAKVLISNRQQIAIYVMGAILMLIVAVIFFVISMMFIIRYITFVVLLAVSPIGFVFIKPFDKYSKQFWGTLQGQATWPIVYFLLTWVILTIMSAPGFLFQPENGGADFVKIAEKPTGSTLSVLINYIMIISLITTSLKQSREIAKKGHKIVGESISKATAFGSGVAGGAIAGAYSTALTNTVGRAGKSISESDSLKRSAESGGFKGFLSKNMLKLGKTASETQFDMRNTATAKNIESYSEIEFGKAGNVLGFSKFGEGGFAGQQKRRIERNGILGTGIMGTKGDIAFARDYLEPTDEEKKEAEKKLKEAKEEGDEARRLEAIRLRKESAAELEVEKAKARKATDDFNTARRAALEKKREVDKIKKDLDDLPDTLKETKATEIEQTTEIAEIQKQIDEISSKYDEILMPANIRQEREALRQSLSKKKDKRRETTSKIAKITQRLQDIEIYRTAEKMNEIEAKLTELQDTEEEQRIAKTKAESGYRELEAKIKSVADRFLTVKEIEALNVIGQKEEKDRYGNIIKSSVETPGQRYLSKKADDLSGAGRLGRVFMRSEDRVKALRKAAKDALRDSGKKDK